MPIATYDGETYVAYLDISGFKELMKKAGKAEKALGQFYITVNSVGLGFCPPNDPSFFEVNAVLFSDSAILFSRNPVRQFNEVELIRQDKVKGICSILTFIQRINWKLISFINNPIMTACSIDYGKFRYEDRIEFEGIDKGFVIGKPFVNAFLDVENGRPKIQPGECRLLKSNLALDGALPTNYKPFSLLESRDRYYYFHWMIQSLEEIERFKQDFEDTYQLKYAGMIQVLQKYALRAQRTDAVH